MSSRTLSRASATGTPGPPPSRWVPGAGREVAEGSGRRLLLIAVAAGAVAVATAGLVLRVGPLLGLSLVAGAAVLVRASSSSVWAVGVFVLALPVGLIQGLALGPVDVIHVVGAGVVVLVVLHQLLGGRAPLRWHPDARWAVLLAAWTVVAAVTAVDVRVAVQQAVALAVGLGLALAVNTACARPADLRQVLTLLAAVGAGVCAFSLGDVGSIEAVADNPGAVGNRAVGIFSSPNELGVFSGVLLFVGLALAFGGRTRLQQVVGGLCAVSSFAALLMSLSRGSWIGASLGLLVLLCFSSRARRVLPVALLLVGVGGSFVLSRQAPELWAVVAERAATVTQPQANPDDARGLIYEEAARQIAARPLTGSGPGGYPFASQTAEATSPAVDALHAHNVPLAVAAEAGIPAAAALLVLTVAVARRVLLVRRQLATPEREVLLGLSCALAVVLGQGLVDFPYRNPTLLFLVWAILGLVFAATAPRGESRTAEAGTARPVSRPVDRPRRTAAPVEDAGPRPPARPVPPRGPG